MIKIDLDLMESMLYYWHATSDKEKVGEKYIISIAENNNMKYLYNDDFDGESVRKVLSAISNREIFKAASKKEGRFWNNNMWMLEDLEFTNMMILPIKTLNLDNKVDESFNGKDYIVSFVPGHIDTYYIDKLNNKLIINFFKIVASLYDDSVTISDMPIDEFIIQKFREI